jgi:murein DD-endopeptidase MepM/ murein hydrolase activator NlpD
MSQEMLSGPTRIVLASLVALSLAASAGAVTIPGLVTVTEREDPTWIGHFPLQNFVSWEAILVADGQLTYTGGTVRYRNEAGVVIRAFSVPPTRFAEIARETTTQPPQLLTVAASGNVVIPAGSNVFVPFSRELIDMNLVPATSEMELCFDELEATPGACSNPIQVGVVLEEYVAPPGASYRFPLVNPSQPDNSTGMVTVGGNGHEIGTAHRLARNQRYAYDVGVRVAGSPNKGIDDTTNADYYVYEEWVVATQDGVVTVSEQGHPDNTPPNIPSSVGTCVARTCGQPLTCLPGQIPGGGNSVVLDHGTGEWSFIAHMQPGSNDATLCGEAVSGGDVLGLVGNSGSSSAPHVHVQSVNGPNAGVGSARSFPMYYNNVEFSSTAGATPRRQLDVEIPSNTSMNILFPPPTRPLNPLITTASETEPNDTPAQHEAILLGATVFGSAEDVADTVDVPEDVAIRGDGIEDIFRFDAPSGVDLHVELSSPSSENLDVYLVTEDLRVQNPTRQGTRRLSPDEDICLGVESGAHYLMVTNNDVTKSADATYELTVEEDPQRASVEILEATPYIAADGSCYAILDFEVTIEDGCCVDPNALSLDIIPLSKTGTVTFGPVTTISQQIVSPSEVTVRGSVQAFTSSGCPGAIEIFATAEDCDGNPIDDRTIVETVPFTMPAAANIYGAGRLAVPDPGSNGGGVLPVEIALPPGTGRVVTFDGVAGTIDFGLCCLANGPDGIVAAGTATGNDWDGLAGMQLARGRFVAAVFLDDSEPAAPAPAQLDLTLPDIEFDRLSPALRQIFFVGDGRTSGGGAAGGREVQTFVVPDEATRIFLGVIDAGPPDDSVPGFYGDNSGSVTGSVVIKDAVPVPEPGHLPGLVVGFGWLGAIGAGRGRPRAAHREDLSPAP